MAEAKKTTKSKAKATEAELAVAEQEVVETPVVEAETITTEEATETKATAKAGKRSHKSQEEAAAKEAKEERKASGEEADSKPKQHANPTRSRLERQSKNFRKSAEKIEAGKAYALADAIKLAKETSTVKFDATVELHVNLAVDPRQADQNIRDNVVLPAGSGKTVRVAVLTDDAAAAKKAGADIAGTDELLAQLDKGQLNFDILIATPALMAKLGKYARVLGPRGLMPNPKSGTVTTDINKAISESKAGKVEYRVDSTGIIHIGVGKVSFTPAQLQENLDAVLANIKSNKPNSIKGVYFKAIHLATTMGPSITVDLASVN